MAVSWVLAMPTHAAQASRQGISEDIPVEDLVRWDTSSRIRNQDGDILTVVSVRSGKLDFSRPDGQTRNDFLKSLYAKGVRQVFAPFVSKLEIDAQGRLLLNISLNEGVGQALKETEDGFDLVNAVGSQLLDRQGRLLATVSTVDRDAALTLPQGETLESAYASGLRIFYYRARYFDERTQPTPVTAPGTRRPADMAAVQLVRDPAGKVVLKR
ncbi:MAG: hypothetical protein LAO31_03845 [Acidobacteriia bacterium]|nr:hypothetical protein [Terriglobia bacterium]